MKVENWNGYEIRFVEKEQGEWWAVAKDVTDALGFSQAKDATKKMPGKYKGAVSTAYGHPKMIKKEQMTPDMLARRQAICERDGVCEV